MSPWPLSRAQSTAVRPCNHIGAGEGPEACMHACVGTNLPSPHVDGAASQKNGHRLELSVIGCPQERSATFLHGIHTHTA